MRALGSNRVSRDEVLVDGARVARASGGEVMPADGARAARASGSEMVLAGGARAARASGDEVVLAGGERVSEATAMYVAPLKENFAALSAQSAMIFKATEAAMNSKKRLDHTKLLLSLPKTGMTKGQLECAVKKARKRIRDARMVKERVLKERSSRPRLSPEHSSPLFKDSNRSDATESISEERIERRDPSYGACESKIEDDADTDAAETLSLLAMNAARQEPQLQGMAGDSCSSVEQALRATNDTGDVTDRAASDAAMCAASELQSVDVKLSAKEQEIAQLREQLERDKATAEQDISRLKAQLQAMRVMLRSQPANIVRQLKDQQRTVFEDQSRARDRLDMEFRARELEMKRFEDHLAAKAKELERAQICLRRHEASTGVDEALSDVMDTFRKGLSAAEWRSIAIVPGASDDGVIVSRRIDYVSLLYAHIFEVDREAIQSALYRWKNWRNRFSRNAMRDVPSSSEMRILEESEHIKQELIRLNKACKEGRAVGANLTIS